jgi:hypothetical protein
MVGSPGGKRPLRERSRAHKRGANEFEGVATTGIAGKLPGNIIDQFAVSQFDPPARVAWASRMRLPSDHRSVRSLRAIDCCSIGTDSIHNTDPAHDAGGVGFGFDQADAKAR